MPFRIGSFRVVMGIPVDDDREMGGRRPQDDGNDQQQQPDSSVSHHNGVGGAAQSPRSARESHPGEEEATTNQSTSGTESAVDGDESVASSGEEENNNNRRKGRMSKRETYIVVAAAIAVLAGIVLAAVVITGGGDGSDDTDDRPSVPTAAPTAPTLPPVSREHQLDILLQLIGNLTSTQATTEILPANVEFYNGLFTNTSAPAAARAMSWVLNEDPTVYDASSPFLPARFGLATLYYNNGGDNWTNATGWLTGDPTCSWFGLSCDRNSVIEQLDLQSNNLVNNIPNEIALIRDLRSIWLRRNKLNGTLPARAFNDLLKLRDLFLEDNMLTGRIPPILAQSVPPLSTLFLQQNLFTGLFPTAFCTTAQRPILKEFGIDCFRNGCVCCDQVKNCF